MTVGFVWDERYAWHDTGSFGPMLGNPYVQPGEESETPDSKRRIRNRLDVSGLLDALHAAWAGHDVTPQQEASIRAAEALAARLR